MKKERAVGVIIRNNKILLLSRIKKGWQFFCFPGGGIEPGETPERAVVREIEEECSSKNKIIKFLFKFKTEDREAYYYLIDLENEEPILGGPEINRQREENRYEFVWLDLQEFAKLENFYPPEAKEKLLSYLS